MFMPDVEAALREFVRVLKPGGFFVATVWQGKEEVRTRVGCAGACIPWHVCRTGRPQATPPPPAPRPAGRPQRLCAPCCACLRCLLGPSVPHRVPACPTAVRSRQQAVAACTPCGPRQYCHPGAPRAPPLPRTHTGALLQTDAGFCDALRRRAAQGRGGGHRRAVCRPRGAAPGDADCGAGGCGHARAPGEALHLPAGRYKLQQAAAGVWWAAWVGQQRQRAPTSAGSVAGQAGDGAAQAARAGQRCVTGSGRCGASVCPCREACGTLQLASGAGCAPEGSS